MQGREGEAAIPKLTATHPRRWLLQSHRWLPRSRHHLALRSGPLALPETNHKLECEWSSGITVFLFTMICGLEGTPAGATNRGPPFVSEERGTRIQASQTGGSLSEEGKGMWEMKPSKSSRRESLLFDSDKGEENQTGRAMQANGAQCGVMDLIQSEVGADANFGMNWNFRSTGAEHRGKPT